MFKKYGMEKYDPTNEPFDPHRHNAAFELPDASKPPGTVAVVLKVFLSFFYFFTHSRPLCFLWQPGGYLQCKRMFTSIRLDLIKITSNNNNNKK